MLRAARTTSPFAELSGVRLAHLTSTLTGVTSQFFGLMSLKTPTTVACLPVQRVRIETAEYRLLHLVVDGRTGILVLDLIGELAEFDGAGCIAEVGAVDRRTGLDTDHRLGRQPIDLHLVGVGLAGAEDAGQRNRYDRPGARCSPEFFGGGLLVGGDGGRKICRRNGPLLDIRLDLRELLGTEGLRRERLLPYIVFRADLDDRRIERDCADDDDGQYRAHDELAIAAAWL
jgi:hypothetical protein